MLPHKSERVDNNHFFNIIPPIGPLASYLLKGFNHLHSIFLHLPNIDELPVLLTLVALRALYHLSTTTPNRNITPLHNLPKTPHHILHILIPQPRMQRQRHLILKQMIRIREVLDIKAKRLIRRHHWQRLIMHIAGNPPLRHLHNHIPTLRISATKQTGKIQMPATGEVLAIVLQHSDGQILQRRIESLDNLPPTLRHPRIATQLRPPIPLFTLSKYSSCK